MEWMAAVQGTATVRKDPETVWPAVKEVHPQDVDPQPPERAPDHRAALADDPTGPLVEISVGAGTVRRAETPDS